MKLDFTPVTNSSVIAGHHYDPTTNVLHVQTKSGHVYRYDDVPAEKAEAFAGSASKGVFWNKKIVNRHKAVKVQP